MAAAVAAAKAADTVVFVIGGDWAIEHEGMDRRNISLPGELSFHFGAHQAHQVSSPRRTGSPRLTKTRVTGSQATLVRQVRQAVGPSVPIVVVMVHGACFSKLFSLISWLICPSALV